MNKWNKTKILYNIATPMVIAMFFLLDRILKNIVLGLDLNQSRPILADILVFRLTFNQNIAFSLPLSGVWLNVAISLMIFTLFLMIIQAKKTKTLDKKGLLLLIVILVGAISNLLDRFLYGAVIDYLDLKHFTIFNLADIMISMGVITFFILSLKKYQRSNKKT